MALHFFHLVAAKLFYPELLLKLHFQITGAMSAALYGSVQPVLNTIYITKSHLITVPSSSLSILHSPHTSFYICVLVVIDRVPVMSGHISHFCNTFS